MQGAAARPRLRQHIGAEQLAVEGADAATRAFLLADFHLCLAECLGHRLLADMLRDLTARTTLVATLYQSRHDAAESCADHARIVSALEAGDVVRAESLMLAHIGNVRVGGRAGFDDAITRLLATIEPHLQHALPLVGMTDTTSLLWWLRPQGRKGLAWQAAAAFAAKRFPNGGDIDAARSQLSACCAEAPRLGGSHAQRMVVDLTLARAAAQPTSA